jgi:hypothetical protein
MDSLTLFGLLAVSAMLVCYALESRSHWFVLAFAASCALGSAYGFLQDELAADAHSLPGPAHATLEDIADAKVAADLL